MSALYTLKRRIVHLVLYFIPVLLCFSAVPVYSLAQHPVDLIQNGAFALQAEASDYTYNQHKQFIPASTIKLLTSLAALKILGADYRFTTKLYLTEANDLYIEGGGDPFLTSEVITQIASQLKKRGVSTIRNLVFDSSSYDTPEPPEGSQNSRNPYDTRNGALVVNFNSLAFLKRDDTIISAEKQTPTIPLMHEIGQQMTNGKHRINVWAFYRDEDISIRYTGELFSAIFLREGISLTGKTLVGSIPQPLTPVIIYKSQKDLTEIIHLCLQYSNNFIANQIFLEIGKHQYGKPATWEKSRQAMKAFIASTFNSSPLPRMVEGSGLSRQNLISAKQLLQVLDQLSPWASLILESKDGMMVKSGTLTGAYCYAGYFKHFTRLYPFAILLNQKRNSRDKLLNLLYQHFSHELHHENSSSSQPAT